MVFPENIKAAKERGNAETYSVNHCGLDMPLKSIITVFVLAPVVVVSPRQATGERGAMGAMLRLFYIASMKKEALQMGYVSDPISGVWLGCGCTVLLPTWRYDATQFSDGESGRGWLRSAHDTDCLVTERISVSSEAHVNLQGDVLI
jgi:hypothetical protein